MKYRKLGITNLDVSVVGIGTWQFGGEWGHDFTQPEVDAILNQAKAEGINLIDTAECYGDHLSEQFIGSYLTRHNRGDWIIATKFGHHFHSKFERTRHWNPDEVLKQLDQSLRALKTEYIDVYQAHSCTDEEFNNDDLWTMLDKQKQAGKIRHLAISLAGNQDSYQTEKASEVGAEAIQVVYNRLDRAPEESIFPSAIQQNLGVLARVPLASGYLSGKYKPGTTFQASDVRSRHDEEEVNRQLRIVEEIGRHEVPDGVDMATWALAWCLKHNAVTTVIPGCKNPEQVSANAKAASLDLVSDQHPQSVK
ncbi:aryl-alcohol dehydrogenase-like predicted oxidoreductase [Gracilibacillus halotolerans]|uniref:Aryl-alcohol dehydrogenase-like predicted oxidoreductase n=1 Tax=Gracilibacillus halotolerans TaxID=74386 RepID=A0A841RNG6_9BACI|nr:aldo/keto reductase [Gracilibacillus halotolerans]MBB6512208.1 aryl-alcohol dehydrogenase-like predicted oxidoreductase [Gracilibacillus halotolerans]